MMIKIEKLHEFDKDVKVLSKKYRTLPDDIAVLEKILLLNPDANPNFSFRIEGLGLETCVIKVKKIASRSFKGRGINSGFRLVYAYFEEEQRIVYVELYHKNDKPLEDRIRIKKYFR